MWLFDTFYLNNPIEWYSNELNIATQLLDKTGFTIVSMSSRWRTGTL